MARLDYPRRRRNPTGEEVKISFVGHRRARCSAQTFQHRTHLRTRQLGKLKKNREKQTRDEKAKQ